MSTAGALVVVSGATAADLPSRKAAPVEYVRVCNTYGAGFFYIPGSDTCLRVGGRVRFEALYNQVLAKDTDSTGLRARGRVILDARTATAYGTLRAYASIDVTRSTGAYAKGAFQANSDASALDKGFIQFGPITAGRASSMFDFYANSLNMGTLRGSDSSTQLLAYTATFGSGFSATISAEDGAERRNASSRDFQGSNRMPDIVANLEVTQGWGSAQVSGAVHEITASSAGAGLKLDSKYGFAGQAGVKINLPMLAAGDQLWLQGSYAEGALSYLGAGSVTVGGVKVSAPDSVAISNGTTASVKLTKGYALTAGLLHYWTPTVRQAVFGSFLNIDSAKSAGLTDFKEYRIGSNVFWSPVKDFNIGVEVLYAKLDPKGRVADKNRGGAFTLSSDDSLQARLRIQRDF
ncbi:MAG: porin [Bosea sp. (in: a-proteobacteria)]